MAKQKKTLRQKVQWWWNTRIIGWWKYKRNAESKKRNAKKAGIVEFKNIAQEFKSDRTQKNDKSITVILTAYKRSEYLVDQIKALKNQTCPPNEIWVWTNKSDIDLLDVSEIADRVVVSNTNWKFWGRFSLAMMVRTEFVAFFDDDILPNTHWFENCLNTIENGFDGILGGSGVILPTTGGYSSKSKAGWNGLHTTEVSQVDLVGHAWFMRKRYVQYIWREEPVTWDNGEDIHLSYMALKYGEIKTFVPPHPEGEQHLWSCQPEFGKVVGRLNVATYKTVDHKDLRSEIVDAHRADGWKLCSE